MNRNTTLILIDIQNDYFQGGANPLIGSWEASESEKKCSYHLEKKNYQ
jgi:hypothetical protein